jgi:hypothetical protein
MIVEALDAKIWSLCDDLRVTLRALAKVNEDAARRGLADVLDFAANIGAQDFETEAP